MLSLYFCRVASWQGEGFLTSRVGAQRLVRKVEETGIVGCGDQQYNVGGIMNLSRAWPRCHPSSPGAEPGGCRTTSRLDADAWSRARLPWRLREATNTGDRARTAAISV